jgi:hypothetical protein
MFAQRISHHGLGFDGECTQFGEKFLGRMGGALIVFHSEMTWVGSRSSSGITNADTQVGSSGRSSAAKQRHDKEDEEYYEQYFRNGGSGAGDDAEPEHAGEKSNKEEGDGVA